MNKEMAKLVILVMCIVVFSVFMLSSVFSPDFNHWERKIARYFITDGWKELSATNTVTAIVWEFRGYDTLGEESVLFTAAMGVLALGFGLFSIEKTSNKEKVR
ncbi:MAG: hydrogen gas-evolving membrane-bound hydrogenase subunit E [Candidatus Aenigmatarchaeota archaeon]